MQATPSVSRINAVAVYKMNEFSNFINLTVIITKISCRLKYEETMYQINGALIMVRL